MEGDTEGSEHGKYTEDGEILGQMMDILNGENFLFTLPEFETEIAGVLETLKKRSGRELSSLNILSLPLLLFELANKPGSEAQEQECLMPFESVAEREFEKEKFLYYPDMNCAWHEKTTDTCHCSSARVKSWIYTVLDASCHRYNIDLLPVQHYPLLPALPS